MRSCRPSLITVELLLISSCCPVICCRSFSSVCTHLPRVISTVLIVRQYFVAPPPPPPDVPIAKMIPRPCTFELINCRRACKWLDREEPCNTGKSSDVVVCRRTWKLEPSPYPGPRLVTAPGWPCDGRECHDGSHAFMGAKLLRDF